jgi:hypothetical protein
MATWRTGRSGAGRETISGDLLSKVSDYCKPAIGIRRIGYDADTGQLDLSALEARAFRQQVRPCDAAWEKGGSVSDHSW